MVVATYALLVDWDNDGDFLDTGEDVTARTWRVRSSSGRDRDSQLTGRAVAGRLRAVLNNESGDYSSFNSASPLFGNILPGRKVQLTMDGTVIWTGFLSALVAEPGVNRANQAVLEAIGPLGQVNRSEINLPMQTSIATGATVGAILDEAAWPAGDRTIDTGQTTIARIFMGEQKTLHALRIVEATEAGFIRETPDGKIAFEDRNHRLKTPHFTSQATFSDAPAAALVYSAIRQEDPTRNIINSFEAPYILHSVGSLAVLWTHPESGASSPSIDAGESRDFWASYPNPDSGTDAVAVDAWTTLVVTTDYTANSQAGGGGDDHTADIGVAVGKFGTTMKITLTNNAAVQVFITLLQARGTPVTQSDSVLIKAEDSASQTTYGKQVYRNPSKFMPSSAEAQSWCDFNLPIYKDPLPGLSIRVSGNRDAAHQTQVKTRDVSDRITLVAANNAGLGINEDFFIESVVHDIDNQNRRHWTDYGTSPADDFTGMWVLGKGKLGISTRLTY